jgi:hypothetical protein
MNNYITLSVVLYGCERLFLLWVKNVNYKCPWNKYSRKYLRLSGSLISEKPSDIYGTRTITRIMWLQRSVWVGTLLGYGHHTCTEDLHVKSVGVWTGSRLYVVMGSGLNSAEHSGTATTASWHLQKRSLERPKLLEDRIKTSYKITQNITFRSVLLHWRPFYWQLRVPIPRSKLQLVQFLYTT